MDGGADIPKARGHDPYSIAGKFRPPTQRFDVVVVGAGAAGTEAAIAAAEDGSTVLLVDENPVSAGLIGLDVPLYYGQRATPAVQNKGRMIEQIFAANPKLEAAFEAGVEVQLGTYVWGAFVNGPGLNALPEPVVGLADEETSWLCGFKRLVIATGARDLALSFKGWDLPGVMGANALHALITRYDAFAGRRIVVLGSGELALKTAILALGHGLEVAALVEVRDRPQGPEYLVAELAALGVPILLSHVAAEATGGLNGVKRIRLVSTLDAGAPPVEIECDTICQAIGIVPMVELLDVLGAKLAFDGPRGGHTPVLTSEGQSSLPFVSVLGDCAGVSNGADAAAYQSDWMRALLAVGDPSIIVCQCEEVSRGALLGVQQPTYLGPISEGMAKRDLAVLAADGPVNQDQIKRLTRACMGPCQARRCREQVALTLAVATDTPVSAVPLAGYRAPVRPLPLSVLAAADEAPEMSADWDVWFGIPSQWIPYQDIDTDREAMHVAALGGNMHL
jgi:NADPH-dependent 2,4-dienoyl-CoA reductase/sulfur reductase-like enzyme